MTATATPEAPPVVTVPRSEIARALKAASSIKAKHVHLDLSAENVTVTAYTPEVAVRVRLDAPGSDTAGSAFIARKMLASVLPYLGPDVALSIDEETLKLESGDAEFELRAAEEALPRPADLNERYKWEKAHGHKPRTFDHDLIAGDLAAEFEAPILVETLRRTLPFASRDQTRPILANVAFYPDANCAAATDSYRLAVIRYGDGPDKPQGHPLLLNVDGCASLQTLLGKKLGRVNVHASTDRHVVEFEDTVWSLDRADRPKPDGTLPAFPAWWQLLPEQRDFETTVKVDREDLLTAARSISVFSKHAPLRLNVDPAAGASIKSTALDVGKVTHRLASASVEGESYEIGLNPRFTADICKVAPVERLTLKLIAPLRPLLVTAARDQYLLMPIRLNV